MSKNNTYVCNISHIHINIIMFQAIRRCARKSGRPSAAATLLGPASHRPTRIRSSLPGPSFIRNRGASPVVQYRRGLFHRPKKTDRVSIADRHQSSRKFGEWSRGGEQQWWLQPSQSSKKAGYGVESTDTRTEGCLAQSSSATDVS